MGFFKRGMEAFQIERNKLLRELVGAATLGAGLLAQIAENTKKKEPKPRCATMACRTNATNGSIPIPKNGVLYEHLRQGDTSEFFRPVRDQWRKVLHAELKKEGTLARAPKRAEDLLRQFAKEWNECFPFRAVSKSGGYYHLLVQPPKQRLKLTKSEMCGSRKIVPKTKQSLKKLIASRIWKFGETYLHSALMGAPSVDLLTDFGKHVRWNLALLCGPAMEIKVTNQEWNPKYSAEYDCAVLAKQLARVWPNLMGMFRAFEEGLEL